MNLSETKFTTNLPLHTNMKLKQILEVNEQTMTTHSLCGFSLLALAEKFITQVRPDLGPTWLQNRPNLFTILGTLWITGRVNVIDFEEKVSISIKWVWVEETQVIETTPALPDWQEEPTFENHEYHPHDPTGCDRNLRKLNYADWLSGFRCTCDDCCQKFKSSYERRAMRQSRA